MDDERSCDGSAFQTVGTATWKLRRPSCVLVEGTSMSWRSAERRFARPAHVGLSIGRHNRDHSRKMLSF